MWFETHAHLSDPQFDSDRSDVIERAFQNGINTIVEIADGPEEWEKAKQLAEKYPQKMWWAGGIHPYFADKATPDIWKKLETLASHPQFVAIGEVGLDYAKCSISPDVQKKCFQEGIELASKIQKPLIIHCREAFADIIPILKNHFSHQSPADPSPGVLHCFSGTWEEAQHILKLGFYIGVDGPLTYPKAQALRETIQKVPLEKLVLETDSPYLPPQSIRGQRNEPRCLSEIGLKLAELCSKPPQILAQQLLQNSDKLFRLKQI